MMTNKAIANVHRFRDSVAVYVGNGETTYLSAKAAKQLAKALNVAAKSVITERFVDSNVGSIYIHETEK